MYKARSWTSCNLAAGDAAQLLGFKTPATYDSAPLPERGAIEAVELAGPLVDWRLR
jgi:hypothetical protein